MTKNKFLRDSVVFVIFNIFVFWLYIDPFYIGIMIKKDVFIMLMVLLFVTSILGIIISIIIILIAKNIKFPLYLFICSDMGIFVFLISLVIESIIADNIHTFSPVGGLFICFYGSLCILLVNKIFKLSKESRKKGSKNC